MHGVDQRDVVFAGQMGAEPSYRERVLAMHDIDLQPAKVERQRGKRTRKAVGMLGKREGRQAVDLLVIRLRVSGSKNKDFMPHRAQGLSESLNGDDHPV